MTKIIRAETQEIVPRYYGMNFLASGRKMFDNPSTAALAYVAITSPDKQDGLRTMLQEWQARKRLELEGKAGYEPVFKLTSRQAKRLLGCSVDELTGIVREAVKKNHGSYNLWDSYGSEAVADLTLRGEVLTANVKSQKEGRHSIILKGATRGRNGELKYSGTRCGCNDSYWTETKGGQRIDTNRLCVHVKAAELDSFLQNTQVQSPSRNLMQEKEPHEGQRSLSFNFVSDPFLRPLIADVLVAREVLGVGAYEIDRRLLGQVTGPAITPLSLQEEVVRGRAAFEILKQGRRVRELDSRVLATQNTVDEALSYALWRAGYEWQGHCLELGREANRYENGTHAVSVVQGELPFYTVRNIKAGRQIPVFTPDYAPQDIALVALIPHQRVDDRTRKMTDCLVVPAVAIKNIPGVSERSLRYDLPLQLIERYRAMIRKGSRNPETTLKALRIKY